MAEWLEWYRREEGDNQVGDLVSHQPEVRREVRDSALRLALVADGILETHSRERTGDSQIQVVHAPDHGLLLDSFVVLTDPDGRAMSIEYGTKRSRAVAPLRKAIRAAAI